MAAAAVCLARGIEPGAVADGLRTFAGVAHRLERIAVRDGVAFVNDSKATNVASTLVALRSYAGGVHLIAGGRGKRQDFSPLAAPVAERCRAVYLIGEATDELADALAGAGHAPAPLRRPARGRSPRPRGAATAGDTVLLSPACASYDQYPELRSPRRPLPRARGGAVGGRGRLERAPPGAPRSGRRAARQGDRPAGGPARSSTGS